MSRTSPPLADDPVRKARAQWAARHNDESSFVVVVSMLRTYAVMIRELERILKPLDLNLTRFEVLLLLSFTQNQRLPAMKLRDLLLIHGSSATYLVDRLGEAGLVEREADPADRRVSVVALTPAGRRRLDEAIAALAAARWGHVARLDPQQRDELAQLLAVFRGAAGEP